MLDPISRFLAAGTQQPFEESYVRLGKGHDRNAEKLRCIRSPIKRRPKRRGPESLLESGRSSIQKRPWGNRRRDVTPHLATWWPHEDATGPPMADPHLRSTPSLARVTLN